MLRQKVTWVVMNTIVIIAAMHLTNVIVTMLIAGG